MSDSSEQTYQELRARLLSQTILPGTRLIEQKLAAETGAGRTAVREALKRLYGEGLVEKREKRGFVARSWTSQDLQEIREVREILEVSAARLACERARKKDFQLLKKICNDFEGMVKNGFLLGASEADLQFHRTLVSLSGNSKLEKTYQVSNLPLFHYRLGGNGRMNDYDLTSSEHRAIVTALESRNADEVENLIRQHIARGANNTFPA